MRISRWGGAAVLGTAVALAMAAPAAAQDGHFPAGGWEVRQIATGADWAPAEASQITSSSTVELTKPAGDVGTSIETTNLGLEVAAGDAISVSYALGSDADTAAGAIRMFYYATPDADTNTQAPTATAIADGSGTLSLEVADAGTIGTFGLTYDASNSSAGTVTFADLTVGGTPVLFLEPEPEPTPTPEPTPEPTAEPTKPADPDPTDPAGGAGGGDDKPGLPVTGASLPILVGGGAALATVGGGLWWLARRRRVSFTA